MRTCIYIHQINGPPHGFLLLLCASVPAAAGTEDGEALTTHVTHTLHYGQRRVSIASSSPTAAAERAHDPCKLLTSVIHSRRIHQLSRQRGAHGWRRQLLVDQLHVVLLLLSLHDLENLQSYAVSSMLPAMASEKNSARTSMAVSTAAAPQAVSWSRARSAHHEQQHCSCRALPASPRWARAM